MIYELLLYCRTIQSQCEVGKNKVYLTEEDKTKAAISNERRIKSAAINMIFKQMKRLTGLQHLKMSLLFVIRDEGQQMQLIKFAGKGDFLRKLESGEAIMSPQN